MTTRFASGIDRISRAGRRVPFGYNDGFRQERKKADVVEAPKAFYHVGLLTNEPPGTTELLSI